MGNIVLLLVITMLIKSSQYNELYQETAQGFVETNTHTRAHIHTHSHTHTKNLHTHTHHTHTKNLHTHTHTHKELNERNT